VSGPLERPVDLFHVGPQKSGTTWIYRCLREHPQVACPPRDTIHYYDMFYARGPRWYAQHFRDARPEQKLFDPTPSYLRSPGAARRIAADNPEARIALCMRNPIERAFSHYWHEKKKRRFDFGFEEVLTNYDLFSSWIEPGFYAEHVERFLEHFPRAALLCQRYDDLERDPAGFLGQLLAFAGVDPGFTPAVLRRRVNAAGSRHGFVDTWLLPRINGALRRVGRATGSARLSRGFGGLSGKAEYLQGVPAELLGPLREICEPEIVRVERLLGCDLASWRETPGGAGVA